MSKIIISLILFVSMLAISNISAEPSKTMPKVEYKLDAGDESIPNVYGYPLEPGLITESPGIIVGNTFYDQQTNGSTGNRMVICEDGSKYFCWTNLDSIPHPPSIRSVHFNWLNPDGELLEEGPVSVGSGAGYTTTDVIFSNRGIFAYHRGGGDIPTYVTIAIDSYPPGNGFFDYYDPPDELFPQSPDSPGRCYWPYITVDRNDNIHLVMNENTCLRMQRMAYCNSTDGGETWSELQLVDTVLVLGSVIDASPVSDRVVLAYAKTMDTTTQWNNDIAYYVSEDGLTWDFMNNRVNVTNYSTDDDSLWAYTDLDVIIDYNDYVNIVWNAQWVTDEGIYYRTYLLHYHEETGEITEILHHPDSLYWSNICGAWNRSVCKMNMGVHDQSNGVFITWSHFDTSDVSAGGFGNSEIYMSYSSDNGALWAEPINLTNSPSPGCHLDCDSDHWSSLADVVDDSLHIMYINDKDAGSMSKTEGTPTNNPVMYLAYPNPLAVTNIQHQSNLPLNFTLNQNYPNPFNASTTISFNLKNDGQVRLEIYNITGALIAALVNKYLHAGKHDIIWDASDVASVIYFYRLGHNNTVLTKKSVLLK